MRDTALVGLWSWLSTGYWDGARGGAATLPLGTPFGSSDHLARITLDELYPQGTGIVGRAQALEIPGIARLRSLYCGIASRLPLLVYTDGQPESPQRWAQSIEAGRPRSLSVNLIVDDLIFYGRCDLVVTDRADDGSVTELLRIPNELVEHDTLGRMVGYDGHPVALADTVRIDGPHEGILNTAQHKLAELGRLEASLAAVATNPVPVIELHHTDDGGTPLTETEVKALRAQWMTARRDPEGVVGYTPPAIETKTHGSPLSDVLAAGDNRSALTCARIMGAPAWAVDASVSGSSLTYSNVPSRLRELVSLCLDPYLCAIEDRLSLDDVLPSGTWARFYRAEVTRADDRDRWEGYEVALRIGLHTLTDIRALERGVTPEDRRG